MADAPFYGEDRGASEMSEGVAGVIAATITGVQASGVLDRLPRNSNNALVYRVVDITS